jgi:arylsulfatase A-like enzyme
LFWEYGRNAAYLRPGSRPDADQWGAGSPHDASPNVAIRDGRWKLLLNDDGRRMELYDLLADPKETSNLAQREPEVGARLSAQALAWRRSLPKLGNSQVPNETK